MMGGSTGGRRLPSHDESVFTCRRMQRIVENAPILQNFKSTFSLAA